MGLSLVLVGFGAIAVECVRRLLGSEVPEELLQLAQLFHNRELHTK